MKTLTFSLTAGIALVSVLIFDASAAFAQSPSCEVVSVQTNAWMTKADPASKTTLKNGDRLTAGTSVQVMKGGPLFLSFDSNRMNLIQISENTQFKMLPLDKKELGVELSSGTITAALDRWDKGQEFKITTPVAVAAVRGTRFLIGVTGTQTQFFVQEGKIRIYPKDAQGN